MEPDDGYRMTPDVDESEIISVVQMKEMIDKTGLSGRYTTETLYGSMNEAAKLDAAIDQALARDEEIRREAESRREKNKDEE